MSGISKEPTPPSQERVAQALQSYHSIESQLQLEFAITSASDCWQDTAYGPGRMVLVDSLVQQVFIFSSHSPASLEVSSAASGCLLDMHMVWQYVPPL